MENDIKIWMFILRVIAKTGKILKNLLYNHQILRRIGKLSRKGEKMAENPKVCTLPNGAEVFLDTLMPNVLNALNEKTAFKNVQLLPNKGLIEIPKGMKLDERTKSILAKWLKKGFVSFEIDSGELDVVEKIAEIIYNIGGILIHYSNYKANLVKWTFCNDSCDKKMNGRTLYDPTGHFEGSYVLFDSQQTNCKR